MTYVTPINSFSFKKKGKYVILFMKADSSAEVREK